MNPVEQRDRLTAQQTKPKPDTISESTIARMAGNIMSGIDFVSQSHAACSLSVELSVLIARAIAAEVRRTRPEGE